MVGDWDQIWMLVVAFAALCGWWIAVRPRASYASISATMSFLIILMAILLSVLAMSGQGGIPRRALADDSRVSGR